MVFQNVIMHPNPREQKQWPTATLVTKRAIMEEWFNSMKTEGREGYGLMEERMEFVLEINELTSPFDGWDGSLIGPIGEEDAVEVQNWARANPLRVRAVLSRPPHTYAPTKFRFFRRMHLWMQMTADASSRYEEAQAAAGEITEIAFSFEDFVNSPEEFTEDALHEQEGYEQERYQQERWGGED
jgi:hypothetical protein